MIKTSHQTYMVPYQPQTVVLTISYLFCSVPWYPSSFDFFCKEIILFNNFHPNLMHERIYIFWTRTRRHFFVETCIAAKVLLFNLHVWSVWKVFIHCLLFPLTSFIDIRTYEHTYSVRSVLQRSKDRHFTPLFLWIF